MRHSCAPCCPPPPPTVSISPGCACWSPPGGRTTLIPPAAVEALLTTLRAHGADVTERWAPGGHGLTQEDLAAVAAWLAEA